MDSESPSSNLSQFTSSGMWLLLVQMAPGPAPFVVILPNVNFLHQLSCVCYRTDQQMVQVNACTTCNLDNRDLIRVRNTVCGSRVFYILQSCISLSLPHSHTHTHIYLSSSISRLDSLSDSCLHSASLRSISLWSFLCRRMFSSLMCRSSSMY